jgi:hypothetical protein
MRPSVGRIVHYQSYGTPGGEYASECRAAIVTGISAVQPDIVHLAVLNPTGLFFDQLVEHDETTKPGGTWHWPERVDD